MTWGENVEVACSTGAVAPFRACCEQGLGSALVGDNSVCMMMSIHTPQSQFVCLCVPRRRVTSESASWLRHVHVTP